MSDATLPSTGELAERCRDVLEGHWHDVAPDEAGRARGFTVPNDRVYPHQWLWDSCFHAVVWAALGEDRRALAEVRSVFARQGADGFVPHMTYWLHPELHAAFWGRRGSSAITQPPVYGHALAELHRRGIAVDDELVACAQAGLRFLAERRDPHGTGAVVLLHPWESGCDDSPRWDPWFTSPDVAAHRREVKGHLVDALVLDPVSGSPVGSSAFAVDSAGFTALVAWNLRELGTVPGSDADWCTAQADRLAEELGARWDASRRTFDDRVVTGPSSARAVRTLDALLGLLVVPEAAGFAALVDPDAYGGACGPAGVHRDEPSFDPATYWRGPAWPQLTYLLWRAARAAAHDDVADQLADALVRGAWRSGFAEHWHPDTGAGGGAAPQSWTTLALVVRR